MTIEDIPEELRKCDGAFIKSVTKVNHKPHPFTIGHAHVTHAADKCGGMLGQETIKAIPCAHPGCRRSYEEHTCDAVAFVKLTRDIAESELRAWLVALADAVKDKGLDGFAFIKGFNVIHKA